MNRCITTEIMVELLACKLYAPEPTKKAIDAAVNEIERLQRAMESYRLGSRALSEHMRQ